MTEKATLRDAINAALTKSARGAADAWQASGGGQALVYFDDDGLRIEAIADEDLYLPAPLSFRWGTCIAPLTPLEQNKPRAEMISVRPRLLSVALALSLALVGGRQQKARRTNLTGF